jgi:hypothetical protein
MLMCVVLSHLPMLGEYMQISVSCATVVHGLNRAVEICSPAEVLLVKLANHLTSFFMGCIAAALPGHQLSHSWLYRALHTAAAALQRVKTFSMLTCIVLLHLLVLVWYMQVNWLCAAVVVHGLNRAVEICFPAEVLLVKLVITLHQFSWVALLLSCQVISCHTHGCPKLYTLQQQPCCLC